VGGLPVYRYEFDEQGKTLKLWVRRKRGNRKLVCSGCGRKLTEVYDIHQREIRDLPQSGYRTTLVIELCRVCCPDCGVKTKKVPQLPGKAPFSKRFEEARGCESSAVRLLAGQFGLAVSAGRAIDLRYLKRSGEKKAGLAADGVDEIYIERNSQYKPQSRSRMTFSTRSRRVTEEPFDLFQRTIEPVRSGCICGPPPSICSIRPSI
jgi:transposase